MMFYLSIFFWCISILSWFALQFFAKQYQISDMPFWDWLIPADFFLVIVLIDRYLAFNFQYIAISFWLLIWLLIVTLLIFKSDDQHSLKAFWLWFINLTGVLLLIELAALIVYIFFIKH
ncbi:hypothetical protein J3U91_00931 [Oenococcus oeni]|nr:hypothetical protein J3U91_00931 [Oenococcus oeni]